MFKKIVEFFTGKKPETKSAHPLDAVTTPNVPQAPYKLEPAPQPEMTPIPYVPEPPLAVETAPAPKAAAEKKKRTFAKKPAAIKAPAAKPPAKPRAKKPAQ